MKKGIKSISHLTETVLMVVISFLICSSFVLSICVLCLLYLTLKSWILFGLLIMLLILFALFIFRFTRFIANLKIQKPRTLLFIIMFLYLFPQITLIAYVEAKYTPTKFFYSKIYFETTDLYEEAKIKAVWNITLSFRNIFHGTYGQTVCLPSRFLSNPIFIILSRISVPLLHTYLLANGFNKIVVIQKTGGCGEFAIAIAYLLNDVTHFPTRIIQVEGMDHMFPEIRLDEEWWVLDATYTTKNHPVKSSEYAKHLKALSLNKYVARLIVSTTGLNVLKEHGFNASVLVIKAIIDPTTNPLDDKLASHAEIQIFAKENLYDPLIATGITDKNGNFNITLNTNKEYIIIIKTSNWVGIDNIYLVSNKCTIKEIKLHKYS